MRRCCRSSGQGRRWHLTGLGCCRVASASSRVARRLPRNPRRSRLNTEQAFRLARDHGLCVKSAFPPVDQDRSGPRCRLASITRMAPRTLRNRRSATRVCLNPDARSKQTRSRRQIASSWSSSTRSTWTAGTISARAGWSARSMMLGATVSSSSRCSSVLSRRRSSSIRRSVTISSACAVHQANEGERRGPVVALS